MRHLDHSAGACIVTIRTVIIDDEEAARSRLRKMLAAFADIEIVAEASDGLEAVDLIVQSKPDLIFLDVQMPALDGFEVLRTLPMDDAWPLVIFATAYDRYAMDAFEANAVAYLLKPINREKLALAIERVQRLLTTPHERVEDQTQTRSLASAVQRPLRHVVARHRDRYLLIPLDDVCFFRIEDGLVKVGTNKSVFRTDYNLVDLEPRLPSDTFLRVHRGTIVNRHKIAEVAPLFKGAFVLIMNNEERTEIQVSERQSKAVRELLELRPT